MSNHRTAGKWIQQKLFKRQIVFICMHVCVWEGEVKLGKWEREEFSNFCAVSNHYNVFEDLIFCFKHINLTLKTSPQASDSHSAEHSACWVHAPACVIRTDSSACSSFLHALEGHWVDWRCDPWMLLIQNRLSGHVPATATYWSNLRLEGRSRKISSGYSPKPQPVYQMRTDP